MKNKLIKYAAILANIAMIVFALFLFFKGRGGDSAMAILLILPPLFSLIALNIGPDLEERRLQTQVRKASLRKELKDLAEFADKK